MGQKRSHSTKADPKSTPGANPRPNGKIGKHEHDHEHSHSHSVFGHSHSHDEDRGRDAEKIIAALRGTGDRGSHITLVGLFSNIVLTAAKGTAGWFLHSASLLADAGHSASDLLGDFVTLFCWRLSRRAPSERYPYGFSKFETLGTTSISILLIGGALGIGFHSYNLLVTALAETSTTLPPGLLHDILLTVTSHAPVPHVGHHHHTHAVDVNAAWFAAVSVLVKEWLYRVTKTVADEENSSVLLANAIHHRSDAYSSVVALFAIVGTWLWPNIPLDPIGGLLVSLVILQQGLSVLQGAFSDLTDAGVSSKTYKTLTEALDTLVHESSHISNSALETSRILSISQLRARRAGSLMFVDLTAEVPALTTVSDIKLLDEKIEKTLKSARKDIKEVRVTFRPQQYQ